MTWEQWDRILDVLGDHSGLSSDQIAYQRNQNKRAIAEMRVALAELRQKIRDVREEMSS